MSACCWCVQGRVTDVDPAAVMELAEGRGGDTSEMWHRDPLHSVDVGGAAVETLVSLMHADRSYFDASLSELNEEERTYLQNLFQSHRVGDRAQHA
jgi:hypothetical protein